MGIWISGGWAMVALALNGLVIFGMGTLILAKLWARGLFVSVDRAWRRRQAGAAGGRGPVDRLIEGALACRSMADVRHYFEAASNDEIRPFERELRVMKVSISTAPLLGLLGTVTGMLTTFSALATGGGGDQTMAMVADGISEALITTETGLVLGLTGLILQFALGRQHEKYGKQMVHLETLCAQHMQRGAQAGRIAPAGARA
jgi:biopolymer transport protein ExbB